MCKIITMASETEKTQTMEEIASSLTFEQVKEQLALYTRLYYKLRKERDPDYLAKKAEKERARYARNKANKEPSPYRHNKKYFGEEFMIIKTQK